MSEPQHKAKNYEWLNKLPSNALIGVKDLAQIYGTSAGYSVSYRQFFPHPDHKFISGDWKQNRSYWFCSTILKYIKAQEELTCQS